MRNTTNGVSGGRLSRDRIWWGLLYLALVALFIFFVVYSLVPTYRSPDSRLWASAFGYPVLLRVMGRPIPVETAPAVRRELAETVSATGSLRYLSEIPVNVEIPGMVMDIKIQAGDRVRRGDVLMVIDTGGYSTRQAELDLDMKTADYNKAKADYRRQLEAFQNGLISRAQFDESEHGYRDAEIALNQSREALKNSTDSRSTRVLGGLQDKQEPRRDEGQPSGKGQALVEILAPVTGWVKEVRTFPGENFVTSRNGAMTLGDQLSFQAAVDQRYFSQVREGDEVDVYLSALPGTTLPGRVIRIEPRVAEDSGKQATNQPPYTFLAWTVIDGVGADSMSVGGSAQKLAVGMSGYSVSKYRHRAVAVPMAALLRYSGGRGVVLVVDSNDRIVPRSVVYKLSDAGWVAIESGLLENERVIVSGQTGLLPGDRVQ